jgi:hypothetical protein
VEFTKLIKRMCLVGIVILIVASTASAAIVYPTNPPFGARCDGVTDDAPAIQAAIDSLGSTGGTVHLIKCAQPYLLNSYHIGENSVNPYNLLIGSNITLEGDPGAALLQGPRGVDRLYGTIVLTFSKNGNAGCFQETRCTGGFYALRASEANSTQVTLSKTAQTSLFAAGDYVMIYAATSYAPGGGVIPGEPNIVTSVDPSTGALTLQYAMARSFSSPYIVRVTPQATSNVGLKNLVVQGWWPLQLYGVFGAVIQGNAFILDESNRPSAFSSAIIEIASSRQVLFQQNLVLAQSDDNNGLQVPDQSGMNLTFDSDTFYVNALNFGSEYAAHISVQNSHMFVSGSLESPAVVVGGVDAIFSGNDVHGGSSNPNGLPTLLTDYNAGTSFYLPYNGQISVTNNVFDCSTPTLGYCVYTLLPETILTNNQVSVSGSRTIGFMVSAGHAGKTVSQTVSSNQISVVNGEGVFVTAAATDAAVVVGNTIKSSGDDCIAVGNPESGVPDRGSDLIAQNTNSGCTVPISINMKMHPGALFTEP